MSFPLMQAMQVGEYIQKMCLIEQHGAKKDMTEELNTFQNIASWLLSAEKFDWLFRVITQKFHLL